MAQQPRLERDIIIEQRRGSATPPYNQTGKARRLAYGVDVTSASWLSVVPAKLRTSAR